MRTAFGCEVDVPDGYLNTASVGVPPRFVADAVVAAVDGWRTGTGRPPDYDEPVATARLGFAQLVGAPVDRVAIAQDVGDPYALQCELRGHEDSTPTFDPLANPLAAHLVTKFSC